MQSGDSSVGTTYNKKYSSTPTICWKFSRALGTHPDPFISDEVCCYSQPRFDEAAKLFYKLREGCSPDHGSFPIAEYELFMDSRISRESRWFSWPKNLPRVSCMNAGGFPCSKISPVVQFLVRNIDLVWRAATMPNKKLSNRHISPTVQAKRSENSVLGRL